MSSKKISKSSKPYISIIIPVEKETKDLLYAVDAYSQQTYKNFELFVSSSESFSLPYPFTKVITNKKLQGDPASKRNEILKYGKGEIFVFNDDNVFAPPEYLKNIVKIMADPATIGAAGPLLVPENSSIRSAATSCVWQSWLGMGALGGGIHLSHKLPPRIVYDQPAANIILRRKIFEKVGGFEPGLYPGEDTKLCLLIYNIYKKGLQYDPSLFVYHKRSPLFAPHLKKIARYGSQRGKFSLAYPKTSRKPLYFIPAIFLLYIIFLPFLIIINRLFIIPLLIYILMLTAEAVNISFKKSPHIGLYALSGIFTTHIWYGFNFLVSFVNKIYNWIKKQLKFSCA